MSPKSMSASKQRKIKIESVIVCRVVTGNVSVIRETILVCAKRIVVRMIVR